MEGKPIPSLPGYMALETGELFCIPHSKPMPHGGVRIYGNTKTKGQWDGSRYIIRTGGKTLKVARLVCEAFHGPPQKGQVCMHLDENSRNNKPENLAWGSQKENLNAPKFLEYCKGRVGENSPYIKGKRKKEG